MDNVIAYQISDGIDIDAFQNVFPAKSFRSGSFELFYQIDSERCTSVFKYGVVCFLNYDQKDIDEFIKLIFNYCKKFFYDTELTKEYVIEYNANETKFGFHKAEIVVVDNEIIRIVMKNLAQSVALDNYFQHARLLLEGTNKHVLFLEKEGKISISNSKLKKFIGETYHLKNQIIENLRLLDSKIGVAQTESFHATDHGIKVALFINKRVNNIYEELNIISEHLEGFRDILTREANLKLAWIEIVLLATFVIDIIIEKCF